MLNDLKKLSQYLEPKKYDLSQVFFYIFCLLSSVIFYVGKWTLSTVSQLIPWFFFQPEGEEAAAAGEAPATNGEAAAPAAEEAAAPAAAEEAAPESWT